MAMNIGYLTAGTDKESDECYTPRYGVYPIIKHLKAKGYKKIWCPFDLSNSNFVKVLKQHGFIVINTSLLNGRDFFDGPPRFFKPDVIVSNPPFSIKDEVLAKLYELGLPFAIILPQNSLQSIARVDMYIDHGLEYLGFDRRINYYINSNLDEWVGGNHFASGYFCKDVLPSPMVLEKLNPIQESYHCNTDIDFETFSDKQDPDRCTETLDMFT